MLALPHPAVTFIAVHRFVIRLSFSNRYTEVKRVGTVLQVPSAELKSTAGKWTVLCIDVAKVMRAHLGPREGSYLSVKGLVACSSMALRAVFLSDTAYTPETLPRDFAMPTPGGKAWSEVHEWVSLPEPLEPQPASTAPLALIEPVAARVPLQPQAPPPDARVLRAAELLAGMPPIPAPAQSSEDNSALLKLSRVVGYSGEKPRLMVWLQEGDTILYAAAALLIIQELDSGKQRFLLGHTAPICALSAALTSTLVASAQEGPLGIVRLWDRVSGLPLALLQVHASDMQALSLSADGALLAAVGKDQRSRQLLAVWDTSKAIKDPSPPLLDARSMVHHIRGIAWVPAEKQPASTHDEEPQLVSHGYENIRFWRLRKRKAGQGRKLHVCGMPLQHHEGEMFLDVAIDAARAGGGGDHGLLQRRMLVGSSSGKLFQVDVSRRSLEYVFQLHDAPINTVLLSAGFAVTGSADHKLRVWPLDFGAHFLEAEHEGPVTTAHASPDGLKLLVGTATGTIGVLDVPSQRHVTLLRSHTDIIYGLASDPHNREFATASCDGSIRVWELDGVQQQLVELEVEKGCCRTIAYHPAEYAIACGFDDGIVRIFDIASTSLLEEYQQHEGKVLALAYSHGARRLFSAASDGGLCAYDVLHSYQPCRAYAAAPHADSPCLAVCADDTILAVGGLQPTTLLLFQASSLALLRALPLQYDMHALAFGPRRTLHASTSACSLVTIKLPPSSRVAEAELKISEHGGVHRAVAEALHVSENGKHVVTGGNDHVVKVWDGTQLGKPPRSRKDKPDVQGFVGHSDHVTKVQFSVDGSTLLTVGGGDAIFIWEFCGDTSVDEAALVDASLEQAAEEQMQMQMLALEDDEGDYVPTPAEALGAPLAAPAAAGAAALAASVAAGIHGNEFVNPVPEEALEALRARMRMLDEEVIGLTSKLSSESEKAVVEEGEGAAYDDEDEEDEDYVYEEDEDEDDEEDDDDDDDDDDDGEYSAQEDFYIPKKRFQPQPVFEEPDEEDAKADASRGEDLADDPLGALAESVSLERLLGFSSHAHEHVIWQPSLGRLLYASGDTLMLHDYGSSPSPKQLPLRAGSGEISTLCASDDQEMVAVGSGSDAPIAVWALLPEDDLKPALHVRLPGHRGGVQALAFSHSVGVGGCDLLASLGLADGTLRLSQLSTAQPLLQAALAQPQHVVAWSHDNTEIATGGEGGLHCWRVGWEELEDEEDEDQEDSVVTLAYLEPLPPREPPLSEDATAEPQLTAVVYLEAYHEDAPCVLAGDTAGGLTLWGDGDEPLGDWGCAPSVTEIDMLHASAIPAEAGAPADEPARWIVVVAGTGPQRDVLRCLLELPTDGKGTASLSLLARTSLDGAATGMAWSPGATQGIVGTDAGNIWHVHWGSEQAATPLVSAVPPPMTQLAVSRPEDGAQPSVMATVSRGSVMGGAPCGVLMWDAQRTGCSSPLARVHFSTDEATCIALSPADAGDVSLAIGYASGAVRLLAVEQLAMEPAPLCEHSDPVVALAFAPEGRLLSASAYGEVRLSSASEGSQVVRLGSSTGPLRVDSLDVLPSAPLGLLRSPAACWLCSTEQQEVQVWPLKESIVPDADGGPSSSAGARRSSTSSAPPLAHLRLEAEELVKLPKAWQSSGWRCLAVFCPYNPQMIAACGVTHQRLVYFYDFVQQTMLHTVALSEWPTALAACPSAPLVAVAGASGGVRLAAHPVAGQEPTHNNDFAPADMMLHCNAVRSLHFVGDDRLYSASEDEVAQWHFPLFV